MKFLPQDVRRATLDDLPQLQELWRLEKLPVEVLRDRFTEFQVVADPEGRVVGAVGMQITDKQGRLHSELFPRYELAETLRPLLWERHKKVAQNHGVVRVWTQLTAPYWQTGDFHDASGEELAALPANFAGQGGSWSTVQLREQIAAIDTLEKELAMFREIERAKTDRMFKQAKVFKVVAVTIALVLLAWVGWWLFKIFRNNPRVFRR
jgi:N-acetylglutamate synthase-like GNAT family acetyltransferase